MYAETLHAHIRRSRRRSGAPSLGRKMEARDSVPPIRRQGDALFRSGTGDTQQQDRVSTTDPDSTYMDVGNPYLIALRQGGPFERSRFAADAIACPKQATSEIRH